MAEQETLDITPDAKNLVRFARKVLNESPAGSEGATAARKILRECGIDPDSEVS